MDYSHVTQFAITLGWLIGLGLAFALLGRKKPNGTTRDSRDK